MNSMLLKKHMFDSVKRPILFTPGMICDHRLWQQTFDSLSKCEQKIFVDLLGCNDLNEFFQRIHAYCHDQCSLVGFSMGGFISIEYVLQYPHRLSSLVLISTSAKGYSIKEKQQREKIIAEIPNNFNELISSRRLLNWINPENFKKEEILKILKEMACDIGPEEFVRQQTATLNREDRRAMLNKINVPTLIIHGEKDKLVPLSYAEELADIIPHAELKIIENCGHMIPLEKPVELAEILNEWFG